MSQQTTVNVRMDADLKREFDKVCNDLGLTMTTAVTILAKKMTREKRIPFEVSMDPFYSESNLAALDHSIQQLKEGKVVIKTMEELAFAEYIYWQTQDRKTLKKINALLNDINRHPFEVLGKPEPLKGNYKGFWSRRIDDTNRLVYRIAGDILEILSCKGHYDK